MSGEWVPSSVPVSLLLWTIDGKPAPRLADRARPDLRCANHKVITWQDAGSSGLAAWVLTPAGPRVAEHLVRAGGFIDVPDSWGFYEGSVTVDGAIAIDGQVDVLVERA